MKEEKSRIFIASSGRTLTLAEKLAEQLQTEFCGATLWAVESKKQAGATIIEMLENAAEMYDFAVIILARDDVLAREAGDTLKARDNCVFEAGLFIAALGRERCFLVNSVEQGDLPSDLSGIISLPFEEPKTEDLSNRDACAQAIEPASGVIKDAVQQQGRVKDRPLSAKQILGREKLKPAGELDEDQVVVASVQPKELYFEPALQVKKNLEAGIRYVYFFYGDADGALKTCRLLQKVLLARMLEGEARPDDFVVRNNKVRDEKNQIQIVGDLKQICENRSLNIFFLPDAPKLQYVIHNATSTYEAVLYLKHGKEFIQWEREAAAQQFWAEIRKIYHIDIQSQSAVFSGLSGFNVKEKSFYGALKNEMKKYFRGIDKQVIKLCCDGILDDPIGEDLS